MKTAGPIMVVDDDDNVRTMMCVMLEAEGYSAVGARDGLDALERMRSVAPSLVFVDLMMPRMDGEHLIHSMRADAALSHIPIAIMSGQTHTPQALSAETRSWERCTPSGCAQIEACPSRPERGESPAQWSAI